MKRGIDRITRKTTNKLRIRVIAQIDVAVPRVSRMSSLEISEKIPIEYDLFIYFVVILNCP